MTSLACYGAANKIAAERTASRGTQGLFGALPCYLAIVNIAPVTQPTGSQKFQNGEIHRWYRLIWGYPDHLVGSLIDQFKLEPGQRLLDPFVGSGTTLVEGQKRGLFCAGVDANPVAVFASGAKTDWSVCPRRLHSLLPRIQAAYRRRTGVGYLRHRNDPTYEYLAASGLRKRGWISSKNLQRALAIKSAISAIDASRREKKLLLLGLLNCLVHDLSNVKFGPELYCGARRGPVDAFDAWRKRIREMMDDLSLVRDDTLRAKVVEGDARKITSLFRKEKLGTFDAVICSPPYPAEHDYTRNTRLELAFLEAVTDLTSLRAVKRGMLRSHTKNIYVGDDDRKLVAGNAQIGRIANKIDRRMVDNEDGFARYYSSVVHEYFGGMAKHLKSLRGVLRPGAQCAYVVGRQASFAGVFIPTASILADIAHSLGYVVEGVETWRDRRSTTTAVEIKEEILLLTA